MRITLLCQCALLFAQSSIAQNVLHLDLKGAVHHAIAEAPALQAARAQKEISTLNLKSARTSLFPKISASATTGLSAAPPTLTNMWSSSLSFSLEPPIVSSVASGVTIEIAHTKDSIAELDLKHAHDLLIMKVAKAFYAHAAAREQRLITSQKLAILQKQLDVVNARLLQGIKRERDVLRFKAQVKHAKVQELATLNRVVQTRNTLVAAILGRNRQEYDVMFEFTTEYPRIDSAAIPAREPLVSNHVPYKKLALERQLSALDVDVSRRQL